MIIIYILEPTLPRLDMSNIERCRFYESPDGVYGVRILEKEFERITQFCESSRPNETGGILIGRYSEDLKWAEITESTGPPTGSEHGHFLFIRSTTNLIKYLNRLWKTSQYYLGEWHYHPDATSTPSSIDMATMQKLSKYHQLHCPEPVLIIIGGTPSSWEEYVGVCIGNGMITLYRTER